MRRTLTQCRTGLTAAAALVLLTACSGDSGGNTAAPSTTQETSSPAEESSAPEADSEFCTQASALVSSVEETFTADTDPTTLPQALQQAADGIRGIDAPDEIRSDWLALADGLDQLATGYANTDFNDPTAAAEFQQSIADLEQQLNASSTNVETYLRDQCGIDPDATESAAPTS